MTCKRCRYTSLNGTMTRGHRRGVPFGGGCYQQGAKLHVPKLGALLEIVTGREKGTIILLCGDLGSLIVLRVLCTWCSYPML